MRGKIVNVTGGETVNSNSIDISATLVDESPTVKTVWSAGWLFWSVAAARSPIFSLVQLSLTTIWHNRVLN